MHHDHRKDQAGYARNDTEGRGGLKESHVRRQTAVTTAVMTTFITAALTINAASVKAGTAAMSSPPAGGATTIAETRGARAAEPKAFPGAEGWGTDTPGGRGGRVINVTTLADSGPGSFRRAALASGRRIIVFRVSGTITLLHDIDIENPYVTIAGQTAPGGGITLRADPCNDKGVLGVLTHDVVIRYLRLRPGPHPCAGTGESSDGIVVYKPGTHHVVIDHCSISWAVDENISLYDDAHDITFSWNIVSEGLANSTHEEGEHSKGAHLSGERTYHISFHHNLLAHNNDRNPQPTNPGLADIRNNVIYDYGQNAALTSNSHGKTHFNFVGNYYKPGPDSDLEEYELDVYGSTSVGWAFFVEGNIGPHRTSDSKPERRMVDPAGRPYMAPDAFPFPSTRTATAPQAHRGPRRCRRPRPAPGRSRPAHRPRRPPRDRSHHRRPGAGRWLARAARHGCAPGQRPGRHAERLGAGARAEARPRRLQA